MKSLVILLEKDKGCVRSYLKCKVLFLASFSLIIVVAKYSLCADGEAEIAAGKEGCRTTRAQKFPGLAQAIEKRGIWGPTVLKTWGEAVGL